MCKCNRIDTITIQHLMLKVEEQEKQIQQLKLEVQKSVQAYKELVSRDVQGIWDN